MFFYTYYNIEKVQNGMVLHSKIEFYKKTGMFYSICRKGKEHRIRGNGLGLCFGFSGEMFGAARLIFACMIAISLYGIVKYGRCREKISAISLRERWVVGANSGVLRL